MISRLAPVVFILCAITVNWAVNKCTPEQTCVEINKCHERCAKIEMIGSASRLPVNEKADFKKSICGFQKDDPMVCCEAPSESPVCGIITSSTSRSKPREKFFPTCGRIKVNENLTSFS